MPESQIFKKKPKKKKKRPNGDDDFEAGTKTVKKKKLKALDDFIEGVLQEAGEEFLDEFKQVEGQ